MSKRDDHRVWIETHAGRGLSLHGLGERLRYARAHHGLAATLKIAAAKPFLRMIAPLRYHIDGRTDRRYGTDTQGRIPLSAFAFESEIKAFAQPCEPSPERAFHRMMSHLPRTLSGFTFVDVGCGKGRTILYATGHDFARIIGVEFAPELAAIAAANAATVAAATGDRRIEVVCADATRFDPPQTPLVYYLFQPFNNEAPYRLLVETLRRSFRSNPRMDADFPGVRDTEGRRGRSDALEPWLTRPPSLCRS